MQTSTKIELSVISPQLTWRLDVNSTCLALQNTQAAQPNRPSDTYLDIFAPNEPSRIVMHSVVNQESVIE